MKIWSVKYSRVTTFSSGKYLTSPRKGENKIETRENMSFQVYACVYNLWFRVLNDTRVRIQSLV